MYGPPVGRHSSISLSASKKVAPEDDDAPSLRFVAPDGTVMTAVFPKGAVGPPMSPSAAWVDVDAESIDNGGMEKSPGGNDSLHKSICSSETGGSSSEEELHEREGRIGFIVQSFFPFLLAGIGMVAAGLLLDKAEKWYFLQEVPEALVLVTALLGLKGNLEMTLASRLSTLANLGQLDTKKAQFRALFSNVSLVQAQAIVVSFAASILAIITSILEGKDLVWSHAVSLTLTSIVTASAASLILSAMMVFLAIICRKFDANPDNMCTPIAAMLGDVTTLGFLILFGTLFTQSRDTLSGLQAAMLAGFLLSTILWAFVASRDETTLEVLKHGWYIVFIAMVISTSGGYILKFATHTYESLPVFQPVMNGAGGNLVAVQASKISTYLFRFGKPGVLPANSLLDYVKPWRTFALREEESYHALLLLLMGVPGHTAFLVIISFVKFGSLFHAVFYFGYILAAIIQIATLLYIAQIACRVMWKCKINPDSNAIPLLTSLGDLLGSALLTVVFVVVSHAAPYAIPSRQ